MHSGLITRVAGPHSAAEQEGGSEEMMEVVVVGWGGVGGVGGQGYKQYPCPQRDRTDEGLRSLVCTGGSDKNNRWKRTQHYHNTTQLYCIRLWKPVL